MPYCALRRLLRRRYFSFDLANQVPLHARGSQIFHTVPCFQSLRGVSQLLLGLCIFLQDLRRMPVGAQFIRCIRIISSREERKSTRRFIAVLDYSITRSAGQVFQFVNVRQGYVMPVQLFRDPHLFPDHCR